MKTHVTFQSDLFNNTEQRENFVNPDCFGEDVCQFLISNMREKGLKCSDPFGEDWGWDFNIDFNGEKFFFGTNYHCDGFWLGFVERERGILGAVFGIGDKSVPTGLANIIHKILSSNPGISDIRWFSQEEFDKGSYEDFAESPWSPKS